MKVLIKIILLICLSYSFGFSQGSPIMNHQLERGTGAGDAGKFVRIGSSSPYYREFVDPSTINLSEFSVPGSNKQVFFNDGGSFGAASNLYWDEANNWLQLDNIGTQGGLKLKRSSGDEYSLRLLDGGLTIYNDTDLRKEMTFRGNGYVGIGTTSPDTELHISGNNPFLTLRGSNTSYSNAGIQLISGNASNLRALGVFHYVENSDVEWFAGLPYAGNDAYVINRNTGYTVPSSQSSPQGIGASQGRLLTINSSGNLGIGTSSPSFKLDVVGNARASYFALRTNESAPSETSFIYRPATGVLAFGTASTERARFDSSGNLGIGTTSPSSKLHVKDATDISMASNAAGQMEIEGSGYSLSFALDANAAHIYHNSSARDLIFGTDETARMTIQSGGNVGIGTSSPTSKLHVDGNILMEDAFPRFYLKDTDNSAETEIQNTGGTLVLKASSTSEDIRFIHGSTETMRILGGGNVGIGTTIPTAKLQINNNYTIDGSYGGSSLYISSVGGSSYDPQLTNTNDIPIMATVSSATTTGPDKVGLVLYNNDTTAGGFSPMLLFSKRESGSSPYKATMAGIYARSPLGTGNSGSWIDGELIFATSGAATDGLEQRAVIDKSGNFGIGTTSPSEKLHVDGNVRIEGGIYDSNNSIGSSGQVLKSTGTGIEWQASETDDQNITGSGFNTANGFLTIGIENGAAQDISLDGRYLTSYTETDPIYSGDPASSITNTNITNWNTAYGWGDHSTQGYLTTEVDGSPINEGALSVGSGTATSAIIQTNTEGSDGVALEAGSNVTITENTTTDVITISAVGDGTGTDDQNITGSSFSTLTGDLVIGIENGTEQIVSLDGRYLTSETDGSVTNEGSLSVGAGSTNTSILESNTSGSPDITFEAGTNVTLSENTTTNTITINATGDGTGTDNQNITGSSFSTLTGNLVIGIENGAEQIVNLDGRYARSVTDMIAGSGLTGGGDLSLDRTFNVGAGAGISVNANDVELEISNLSANSMSGADFLAFHDSSVGDDQKIAVSNIDISDFDLSNTPVSEFTNDAGYITSEVDGSITNEGALSVGAGTSTTAVIQTNTAGSDGVTLEAGSNITITENTTTDVITIAASSSGGGGGSTTLASSTQSSAYTADFTSGNREIRLVLTGNVTLTMTNGTSGLGDNYLDATLRVVQDGTGGRTLTWPANVKFPGGVTPTLSSGGNDEDVFQMYWNGSNWILTNAIYDVQ